MKIIDNVITMLSSNVWVFERVFGSLMPHLVWDQEREEIKNILKTVYGFEDIELLFPKKADKRDVSRYLKILSQQYNAEIEKKMILTKTKYVWISRRDWFYQYINLLKTR